MGIQSLAGAELRYGMRFYLYSGLRYYGIAAHSYASALQFVASIAETQRVESALTAFLQRLTHAFQQSKSQNDA